MILSTRTNSTSISVKEMRVSETLEEAINKVARQLDQDLPHLRDTGLDWISRGHGVRLWELHQNASPTLLPNKLLKDFLRKELIALGWRDTGKVKAQEE